MTEAFFLDGQGKKEIQAGGPNATYLLPVPIGTFAVTAKIEIANRSSGMTAVSGTLSPGGAIIGNKPTLDSSSVGMSGAADRDTIPALRRQGGEGRDRGRNDYSNTTGRSEPSAHHRGEHCVVGRDGPSNSYLHRSPHHRS
jgi:hypothetical protein